MRALLLIEAVHVVSARALATAAPFSLTEEQAEKLFVPAASPTGVLPATHWWASGEFTPEQFAALQTLAQALPWADCRAYSLTTEADFPMTELLALGLKPLIPEKLT